MVKEEIIEHSEEVNAENVDLAWGNNEVTEGNEGVTSEPCYNNLYMLQPGYQPPAVTSIDEDKDRAIGFAELLFNGLMF